jgi:hypothetical protein
MEVDAEARAYDALSQHPRIADLAAIARAVMAAAAETRRFEHRPTLTAELASARGLFRSDASTSFGNALDVLGRGLLDDGERALTCALAAHVVALHPPQSDEDEHRLAGDLLWLATHTPFDATGLLDRALGDRAASLWDAVADRVRNVDRGAVPTMGRGEALVGAVALASSPSKAAARQAAALALEVQDGKVVRALGAAPAGEPVDPVVGEMVPAPPGPALTALLAVTGVLLLLHLTRAFGKVALAYKAPAEVRLSDDGSVRVRWHTEILGRTLRDRDVVVPRAALARAMREVRYPRLALYSGLLALGIGSYVGVATFVDGVRAASPSLLALGLAVIVLGVALDFALSSLAPGALGRCRVLFVPRAGRKLCVAAVDPHRADSLLARLSRR